MPTANRVSAETPRYAVPYHFGCRIDGIPLSPKTATSIITATDPTSKARSTVHTASCEETGSCVRRAIRYGRMNSPALPSNAMPVNPTNVGDTSSATLVSGLTGFRKIFQRNALNTYAKYVRATAKMIRHLVIRWVWLQNVPQSNVRQWRYCR